MWELFHVISCWVPCGKVYVVTSIFETGGEIMRMDFNCHFVLGVGFVLELHTIVKNLIWID